MGYVMHCVDGSGGGSSSGRDCHGSDCRDSGGSSDSKEIEKVMVQVV